MRLGGNEATVGCAAGSSAGRLSELEAALRGTVARAKALASPAAPLAVGLCLGARAAAELAAPGRLERFSALLDELGLYAFGLDAASYGAPVEGEAFRPDWLEAERVRYTALAATILARLLPSAAEGSVATAPGASPERLRGDWAEREAARNLRFLAELCWRLRWIEGRQVTLALEPRTGAALDTAARAARFLEERLFSHESVAIFSGDTGLGRGEAEEVLRRHLGLCLDAGGSEEPGAAVAAARRSGVRVLLAKLSAGLEPARRLTAAMREAGDPLALEVGADFWAALPADRLDAGLAECLARELGCAALTAAGEPAVA